MKILVTGATGYIGGAAAKALRLRGHQVSGLARSESSAAKARASRSDKDAIDPERTSARPHKGDHDILLNRDAGRRSSRRR